MLSLSSLRLRPAVYRNCFSYRCIHTTHRHLAVIKLSDEEALSNFTKVNSKSILYFTATWCPPCKMISPIYENLSKSHTDVAFGKVDIDENSDAAMEFNVQAVPTFVFLKGEKEMFKFSGADQRELERQILALKGP